MLFEGSAGDGQAGGGSLVDEVYRTMREIAAREMARERSDHTLQATALVHEAYLRLQGSSALAAMPAEEMLALATRVIRNVLVDHARARAAVRRGAGERPRSLDGIDVAPAVGDGHDLLAIDDAIERLRLVDDRKATVVQLRFFGGLTHDEIARHLGVTGRTVMNDWMVARAWLRRELEATPEA